MRWLLELLIAVLFFGTALCAATVAEDPTSDIANIEDFISDRCLDCHSGSEPEAGFDLESFSLDADTLSQAELDTAILEKILRRVDAREMPPASAERPEEKDYQSFTNSLSEILHDRSHRHPRVGRVGSLRRLTRTEYQNAIRDLLGIRIEASEFLPKDESSHGFDNITVEELSPTILNRYVTAAQKIARAAVGGVDNGPSGVTIRIPPDRTQEEHVAGLPFGTRGGILFEHHFPQSGSYEIELKLARDRDEKIEGLNRKHDIDVLINRERVHRFQVQPPGNGENQWGQAGDFTHSDSHLKTNLTVAAGSQQVGVTFPKTSSSLPMEKRQPFEAAFNRHRHPRRAPAIYQVSIVGPFEPSTAGKTKARQLIFADFDPTKQQSRETASKIIERLARRAFRRPVTKEDLQTPLGFFDDGFQEGGFEKGIESAIASLLVNPNFLFRVEADRESQTAIAEISAVELASRLSFFIWSSIPDEELLTLAGDGRLREPKILRQQVRRMLADEKSISLAENFASQWLYLRNLESIHPDLRRFPDFDDNLRQSFRLETEGLFQDVLRNDLSVLGLVQSKHTFLNQRLATHYGISGVLGSQPRKVLLPKDSRRGGILRHGSILMVTSYATRTSPTIRGNWILENILGTPAPPPPPNIPNLKESSPLNASSLRERLAQHREMPACASCHDRMDPIGFSLENYDAVGRWREFEGALDIDSKGQFPDGRAIDSVEALEQAIVDRPQIFVRTLTEKLMTFALGRAVAPCDGPAIRSIESAAAKDDYRFSSLVTGIVLSTPFRHRVSDDPVTSETRP